MLITALDFFFWLFLILPLQIKMLVKVYQKIYFAIITIPEITQNRLLNLWWWSTFVKTTTGASAAIKIGVPFGAKVAGGVLSTIGVGYWVVDPSCKY